MWCATLVILLSEKKTHELVPRSAANNKQTSASSITLCAVVVRATMGLPAVFRRADGRFTLRRGPRGCCRVQRE